MKPERKINLRSDKAILILIVIVLILLAIFHLNERRLGQRFINNNQSATNQKQAADPELEKGYEKQVKEILEPFWQKQSSTGIKDQILELTVPYKYKNLHLDLVIAFSLLEQGQQEADQAKIEEALEKLDRIKIDYPWLE